jgi:hypothetical protein
MVLTSTAISGEKFRKALSKYISNCSELEKTAREPDDEDDANLTNPALSALPGKFALQNTVIFKFTVASNKHFATLGSRGRILVNKALPIASSTTYKANLKPSDYSIDATGAFWTDVATIGSPFTYGSISLASHQFYTLSIPDDAAWKITGKSWVVFCPISGSYYQATSAVINTADATNEWVPLDAEKLADAEATSINTAEAAIRIYYTVNGGDLCDFCTTAMQRVELLVKLAGKADSLAIFGEPSSIENSMSF